VTRSQPTARGVDRGDGFRWRGHEVTRLEGFSDAVFAFAITLLIVSLEVPHSFGELVAAMQGFMGFAVCFALFIDVWFEHHRFFRRYGLQDTTTIILNAVLLFLVLFYVYPMKFLFTLLANGLTGSSTPAGTQAHTAQLERAITDLQMPWLMVIYGLGFVAVFAVFTLLYRHALRMRDSLGLDEVEVLLTRSGLQAHMINVAVGIASIGVAVIGIVTASPSMPFWSGMTYFALGPAQAAHGMLTRRRRLALARRLGHRGTDPQQAGT
jgi:hypothetical protein